MLSIKISYHLIYRPNTKLISNLLLAGLLVGLPIADVNKTEVQSQGSIIDRNKTHVTFDASGNFTAKRTPALRKLQFRCINKVHKRNCIKKRYQKRSIDNKASKIDYNNLHTNNLTT